MTGYTPNYPSHEILKDTDSRFVDLVKIGRAHV
mgnify:CR=1 FL=1